MDYSCTEKNYALCRKELDLIPNGNFTSAGYEEMPPLTYIKVCGLTRFWQEDDETIPGLMGDILASIVRHNQPFAFCITGDPSGISVYMGVAPAASQGIAASLRALYPGAHLEDAASPLAGCASGYGGIFTGLPTPKGCAGATGGQLEGICRGMLGRSFTYAIVAMGISGIAVTFGHEKLLEEMSHTSGLTGQTLSGGAQGNISVQTQDYESINYLRGLEELEQSIRVGAARGMWRYIGYYGANDPADAKKLGSLIKAAYSGKDSVPEPFRAVEYGAVGEALSRPYLLADQPGNPHMHPLGKWQKPGIAQEISLYSYKFQTVVHSDQLAVMCRLPTAEFPGFYLDQFVEFDVSGRLDKPPEPPLPIGDVVMAGRRSAGSVQNQYSIEKDDLTRHALIVGITGGGKTNTSKSLLSTLWVTEPARRIPFLVIESAKREYWELRNLPGFQDLLVFTLGSEAKGSSVRYRINPFECMPGVSLQTHIDYLLSTFKAAFELYPPMPYILENAVYQVYDDRGWDIVENTNRYGLTEYPTLSDLYHKIDVVVDSLGYHQEVQSNVKAALQSRVYSLMIGGKGAMLNTPCSVPMEKLLMGPVVMELEDLGDDETKSFVMGILMVQLYEYRKSRMTAGSKKLSHVLLIEEAHRLLKNVPEGGEGNNTRAKSVEFFCNMLAEIRTFGQGILISDQIPTKLAPDTLKNTNLKIVHRTVALEDREAIGNAMNMKEEQIGYLSSLSRGVAAVYAEGDNRPKLVRLPLMTPNGGMNREEVLAESRRRVQMLARDYDTTVRRHGACPFCEERCLYYDQSHRYLSEKILLDKVCGKWAAGKYSPKSLAAFLQADSLKGLGMETETHRRCVLGIVLEHGDGLMQGNKQEILAEYMRYVYNKTEGDKVWHSK